MGLMAAVLGIGPIVFVGTPNAAASGPGLQGGGSVDEAWLTGAAPGDSITLLQNSSPVSSPDNPGTADSLGSLIIRNLTPGTGYQWDDTSAGQTTASFSVLAPGANPATNSTLYTGQPMSQGLNYITMRDGIQLAATVRYPYNTTCSSASPCPTVIEYSGYNVAGPTDPIPFLLAGSGPCNGCGDPNLLPSSSTEVGGVVARLAGFATVSLEMRGMGCSGGAFDLFGYPSDYDAYDAIEIVAHQSWVANHKVGMVGISFSGLSQLPSAGTDPPDLAAIAPMSPTDDLFSTGYPGGIFNSGFAASWIDQRIQDALPAATYSGGQIAQLSSTPVTNVGQPWTYYQIDNELAASSSSTCLANQALHGQSESLSSLVGPQQVQPGTGTGRDPSLFDRRSMSQWAQHITVPVFVSGAAEDEQTGPQWPALLNALASDPHVFANLINGGHIDSTDPQIISRWLEFLDIYVAQKVPSDPGLGPIALASFTNSAAGTTCGGCLPKLRFVKDKTLAKAQADFANKTPRVEILFDSGAGKAGPGNPDSSYQAGFSSWPPAGTLDTFYLGTSGSLATTAPATSGSAGLTLDPSARPSTDLSASANPWAANPPWDWTTVPAADGVAFQTTPFAANTTIVGPATLELWVESATPVLDFQATVTEVRPATKKAPTSQEEYVTSGFLRSSNTTDLPDSKLPYTDPDYLASDGSTLSSSSFTEVNIPIDPIAHTFRAGTELRVVISAPGGDRPAWEFATLDSGQTATVGYGGPVASALVVNQVNAKIKKKLPTCGSLRGEPCRPYQAEGNQ